MKLYEHRLWDQNIQAVRDGEVVNETGHPIPLRAVVHYRWGWPRAAAYRAADWLRDRATQTGEPATVQIAKEPRLAQQRVLLAEIPELGDLLLEGLASGSRHRLSVAHVIVDEIEDPEGLFDAIVHAVAGVMDCEYDEVAEVSRLIKGPHTRVTIRTGELGDA